MPKIVLLLPCHSLEDFPAFHTGAAADELLACWTAPWHPALLVATGQPPQWQSIEAVAELPASDVAVLCSSNARAQLADRGINEFSAELSDRSRAYLVTPSSQRAAVVDQLLRFCNVAVSAETQTIADDFYSLAYWYLQIELLTRQMHFSSNLDVGRFMEHTMAAAQAAVAGDPPVARQALQRSFALLAEQRDHYYPVDAFVIDLTLAAGPATDEGLSAELTHANPTNLWLTGGMSRDLASRDPALTKEIGQQLRAGRWELIGGEHTECSAPLLPAESWLANWRRGREDYEAVWETSPVVYFRRRFGLIGLTPGVLKRAGFQGAIHATLDAGQFPESSQARTTWRVAELDSIDALGCIPLDAFLPETFLKFGLRMGQSMENDYVATVCLAHWAGQTSPWYSDLRRGSSFGMALGRFVTLREYFQETGVQHPQPAFPLDGYQSPYLRQAVAAGIPDPISGPRRRWRLALQLTTANTLATWAAGLGMECRELLDRLQFATAAMCDQEGAPQVAASSLTSEEATFRHWIDEAAARVADAIGSEQGQGGWMLLNPGNTASRLATSLPFAAGEHLAESTATAPHVYARTESSQGAEVLVDVPGWGYAWLAKDDRGSRGPLPIATQGSLVEGHSLRNEFFEAQIDEVTGGLRGLYDFRTRGNRLGQRLVAVDEGRVTAMRCVELEVVTNTELCAAIQSTGELLNDEEAVVGRFTQRFSLWRGSRVLRLHVTVDPVRTLAGDPWKHYMACRWALPRGEHRLLRSQHGVRFETQANRCDSPEFFEIEEDARRTGILMGGLPYHHLSGDRMLDSLLLVSGETARDFEFAVAVDPPQICQLSDQWWQPTICIPGRTNPRMLTGSLFNVNSRHVVATGWEPLWDDDATRLNGLYWHAYSLAGDSGASG